MDVERTIEFLLKNQARMDARFNAKFDRADKRMERLERVVAHNNRLVTSLARYGVSLRSDVRRIDKASARTDEALAKVSEHQNETDDKLNALIELMDRHLRGNGRQK